MSTAVAYKEKLLKEIKTKIGFAKNGKTLGHLVSTTISDTPLVDIHYDARMRFGDISSAALTYVTDIKVTLLKNAEDKWHVTIDDTQLEAVFKCGTSAFTAAETLFIAALIAHGCIRALVTTKFTASRKRYLYHVFAWQSTATTIDALEKKIELLEQRLCALEK